MKLQLLLLLALVGPFCAFTHASPTALPTEAAASHEDSKITPEGTVAAKEDSDVVTGPVPTEPEAVPAVAVETVPTSITPEEPFTEVAATVAAAPEVPEFHFTEAPAAITEAPVLMTTAPAVDTAAPAVDTAAPAVDTAAPAVDTGAPAVDTTAPAVDAAVSTDLAEAEVQTQATATEAEGDENEIVVTEDGLSSGQIIGIVIGALLAMVIVIAIVIAVVRRMGKYSP
ncbi:podoplanin [Leuresthes tenuis]|uniref:podoplanin n=1 Tax=Leuresthes tenuis TaxID=355514 RepID=UPI003B506FB0